MDRFEIPLSSRSTGKGRQLLQWLYKTIVTEKLLNIPGVLLLLVCGTLIALGIAGFGTPFTVSVIGLLLGLPVMYAIVAVPEFGIAFLLIMAYLLFGIMRLGIDFPVGTLMDGIQLLLIIGLFVKSGKKPTDWRLSKDPISIIILVWVGYNLLQVINPVAGSMLAWLYTIRSVAIVMLMYFVFRYHIRSLAYVRILLKLWLLLALLAALYAFKQEYLGFSDAESSWLNSDPMIANLLFIDDHWRKFSFLSDPVAFSYNMVISSILSVCLLGATKKLWKRAVLVLLTAIYLYAMTFSGTRGAYVLIPAALLFYTILNFNKFVFVGAIAAGFCLTALIFVPTSNPSLYRFQSAFRPSEDASYLLRKQNQQKIKPYIITHPFGGGLGATGVWGQRFSPDSYLASFPPDSGYVRVAVELGWIGLFLFCTLMFIMLRTAIHNYYSIENKELKSYCLAMILIIFALNVGNYPQEALVQFPASIYFYLVAALAGVTMQLDKEIKTREHE